MIFIVPVLFIAPRPSRSDRAIDQAGSGENRHLGRPVGRRPAMAGQARPGASARTVKCSGIAVKSARNLQLTRPSATVRLTIDEQQPVRLQPALEGLPPRPLAGHRVARLLKGEQSFL